MKLQITSRFKWNYQPGKVSLWLHYLNSEICSEVIKGSKSSSACSPYWQQFSNTMTTWLQQWKIFNQKRYVWAQARIFRALPTETFDSIIITDTINSIKHYWTKSNFTSIVVRFLNFKTSHLKKQFLVTELAIKVRFAFSIYL